VVTRNQSNQTLASLLNPQCNDTSFLTTGEPISQASPFTVNVAPWRGRHNVYGIFKLPDSHTLIYPIVLTVQQAGSYRKEMTMVKRVTEGYPVEPGYFLLKVHLKTRVALQLILQGYQSHLMQPLNWLITYRHQMTSE
jgi:hypothetical protein